MAQLERSLEMMEADYAETIAAGRRVAISHGANGSLHNGHMAGHDANGVGEDDWGDEDEDDDEGGRPPEGYQSLAGACEAPDISNRSLTN